MEFQQPPAVNGSLAVLLLSLASSTIFIFLFPLRIWRLSHAPILVSTSWLGCVKLAVSLLLLAILASTTALRLQLLHADRLGTASQCLALASTTILPWLSIREHTSSVRPSSVIVLYMLATATVNFIYLTNSSGVAGKRSAWSDAVTWLEFTVRIALIGLESQNKRSLLFPQYRNVTLEETVGVISTTFFWWMNGLLTLGNKRMLRDDDVFSLDATLNPARLRTTILEHWNRRAKPDTSSALLKVLARCFAMPLTFAAVPRLFLIVFRCSQPILIEWAISFVSQDRISSSKSSEGYWLLFTTSITYVGLTITTSIYQHRTNRMRMMVRESLVSLIYNKTLSMDSSAGDAGKAVTVMSTDVDEVCGVGRLFHESWGTFAELIIGLILLARQVSWIWPLPLVFIFLGSRVSRYVAQNLRSRQRAWTLATQKRISALSSILGSMKSVKAIGLAEPMMSYINGLRHDEIESSKRVRWVNVIYNASANAIGIFTPVLTVVLFAITAKLHGSGIDAKTAFSTVATLAIVTQPANMLMTIVPVAISTFGNVDRIQSYLLERSRVDTRELLTPLEESANVQSTSDNSSATTAVQITDATVTLPSQSSPILRNINMSLLRGSVTICWGPTGSGKSMMGKLILGEIATSGGHVNISSTKIGFCNQSAWIPTGIIQEIVCAFAEKVDKTRYYDAIQACCLEHDIDRLPDGHNTRVGSRGINLSGGQRQRLALARLLYCRNEVVVLDDPFNALDGTTEGSVINNLFGVEGWFKKENTTVFLITNSTHYFHIADKIIVLGDSTIKKQGPWDLIKHISPTEMAKFTFNASSYQKQPATLSASVKAKAQQAIDNEADVYRKTGDLSLYAFYLQAAGTFNLLFLTACTALYSFFITFGIFWIKLWTENAQNGTNGNHSMFYMVGYILIAACAWIATSANMWSNFILLVPRSGNRLHQSLLATIIGAPLSFFAATDIGVTLNRFSQDISLVDRQLPNALAALLTQVFKMATQVSVLFTVQRYIALSLPICIGIVYVVQKIYLRTSRQLRVLELEAQSGLYSWFLETTEGLSTIRAFGWESAAESKNIANLGHAMRPVYALLCLQRWLNLVLELTVSAIAIGVVAMAVYWRGSTSGGSIGAAMNVIIVANSTLVRLVETWTQLEVSLGAIARLKSVHDHTPKESRPGEDATLPVSWPEKGNVSIRGLTAGYDDAHMVLEDVSLKIERGQKLVICGRTGGGKSTVVLALLRLIESSGAMEVDGVNLSRASRSDIRQRGFITVPQDPLLLPDATLRFNLDPSSLASDSTLQDALVKVGLWERLSSAMGNGTNALDQRFSELPTTSTGQLQLFGMARAIVKKHSIELSTGYTDQEDHQGPKPILVLDEATSSLDSETEVTIYDIIDNEFTAAGHTVVIIAHRLSVLAKRMRPGIDSVAWFQDGKLVKVGSYEDMIGMASEEQEML